MGLICILWKYRVAISMEMLHLSLPYLIGFLLALVLALKKEQHR